MNRSAEAVPVIGTPPWLLRAAQRGDRAAQDELVRQYEPLVRSVVRRLRLPADCEREDLEQEARIGFGRRSGPGDPTVTHFSRSQVNYPSDGRTDPEACLLAHEQPDLPAPGTPHALPEAEAGARGRAQWPEPRAARAGARRHSQGGITCGLTRAAQARRCASPRRLTASRSRRACIKVSKYPVPCVLEFRA